MWTSAPTPPSHVAESLVDGYKEEHLTGHFIIAMRKPESCGIKQIDFKIFSNSVNPDF